MKSQLNQASRTHKHLAVFLTVALLLCAALLLTACSTSAPDGPDQGTKPQKEDLSSTGDSAWKFTFRINDDGNGYTLIDAAYPAGADISELVIPATYEGLPVTAIETPIFQNQPIKTIVIPDSVTAIPDLTFTGCTELTKITLGSGITSIGKFAFSYSAITELTLPDALTSIDEAAFLNCQKLKTVTFGSGISSITNRAFEYCVSIERVNIPSAEVWMKVTFGSDRTAYPYADNGTTVLYVNGEALTELTIPASITSVDTLAFRGYKALKVLTIPNHVTHIGENAFEETSITTLSIPDSVTSLGQSAFWGCSSLTELSIGNGLTEIEGFTFAGCSSLQKITLSNSITSIHEAAFYNNPTISEMTFHGTLEQWNSIPNVAQLNFPLDFITFTETTVWGDWQTIKEATCTEDGLRRRTADGGIVQEEVIAMLNHDPVTIPAVEPTCEEDGLTEGTRCSRCPQILSAQQKIPTSGHSYKDGICEHCLTPQPSDVWDGTADISWYSDSQSVFTITTSKQLAGLAQLVNSSNKDFVNKTVQLGANLDLNGINWTPIGHSNPFVGVFDGQNHTISNLTMTSSYSGIAGLFGAQQGELKNVTLLEVNFDLESGGISVGALAGQTKELNWSSLPKGNVSNCHATGTITVKNTDSSNPWAKIGGLIGSHSIYATITNCSTDIDIVFEAQSSKDFSVYAGGLCGTVGNHVLNCYTTGDVTVDVLYNEVCAGGLAGSMTGAYTVQDCYTTGKVSASSVAARVRAGGLFGNASTNSDVLVIENCYAAGDVRAVSDGNSSANIAHAGGLVGSAKNVALAKSYAAGNVAATAGTSFSGMAQAYAGMMLGGTLTGDSSTQVLKCYFANEKTVTATGKTNASRVDAAHEPLATIQSVNFQSNILQWSTSIWNLTEGQHPTLK